MKNPAKRLILLASTHSYRSKPFEQAASRLGLEVVKGKDVPLPMLNQAGADLKLDYQDLPKATKSIVEYAETHPVGAIIGLDDSGTLLAAAASQALGQAHNSPEAAKAARNKYLMRQCFAKAGVPSPKFHYFRTDEDPEEIADTVSYPCVLKPVTLAGSRGVMRADTPVELLEGLIRLKKILGDEKCEEFLVEDYIPGIEVALEGILEEGKLHVLALFDKPDPLEGPFFEETIYVTPSRLTEESQQEIINVTEKAAASLGLQMGPIHAELRLNEDGPWLVEVASRSIGGMCSETLHFDMDMTLEELILRQAFGLDYRAAKRLEGAEGVMMLPIRQAGLLKGVKGVEKANAVPLVTKVKITAKENYSLVPLPEGNSYLGFIFASGETPEAVEAALREAHDLLEFDIEPEIELTVVK